LLLGGLRMCIAKAITTLRSFAILSVAGERSVAGSGNGILDIGRGAFFVLKIIYSAALGWRADSFNFRFRLCGIEKT